MSFKFFIALQIFSIITNPKRVNIIAVLTLFWNLYFVLEK